MSADRRYRVLRIEQQYGLPEVLASLEGLGPGERVVSVYPLTHSPMGLIVLEALVERPAVPSAAFDSGVDDLDGDPKQRR